MLPVFRPDAGHWLRKLAVRDIEGRRPAPQCRPPHFAFFSPATPHAVSPTTRGGRRGGENILLTRGYDDAFARLTPLPALEYR